MPLSRPDFAMLFDASPNAYLVLDAGLKVVGANKSYLVSIGRTLEEILGRPVADAMPAYEHGFVRIVESLEIARRTKLPSICPLIEIHVPPAAYSDDSGQTHYWSISVAPVLDAHGEVRWLLQQPVDVTELVRLRFSAGGDSASLPVKLAQVHGSAMKRAEIVLRTNRRLASETEQLKRLFQQAPGFMALTSGPDHRFEFVNDAYQRLVGRTRLIGEPVRAVFADLTQQPYFDLLDKVYRDGVPFKGDAMEIVFRSPETGEADKRFIDFIYQPMFDASGEVNGIFVEGMDVTDSQNAIRELHEREARLRLVVEGARDHAILTTDPRGIITSWSHGSEKIFGWSEEDAVGRHVSLIFTEEDRANGEDRAEMRTAAKYGAVSKDRWHICKDGHCVFLNESMYCLPPDVDGEPQGFLKIGHDETERRRVDNALQALTETLENRVEERSQALLMAEEQLRQAQKMEALGQLTGGIAHDFNNLLAIILSGLELMHQKIAEDPAADLDRYIGMATTSAQRAVSLVQRLLAFSRKQSLDLQPVNVNVLAAGMEDMLTRTLGENIELTLALQAPLCKVRSDQNQVENALLNLSINARDAMSDGGRLTIRSASVRLDAAYVAVHPGLKAGDYVCLSVSDTGSGMDAETIAKAFDPFFTTKPIGQGTGLGLSMIYGFAKQSDGHVEIESMPGRGTTVNLFLPCVASEPVHAPPVSLHQPLRQLGHGETILFVEDEPGVRAIFAEVLKKFGYRTHEAVDATSAIETIDRLDRLDLLITDVGLPGIDGRQLAAVARTHRPDLKVLFVTGYAARATDRAEFLAEGMDMLAKPFTLDALASKVHGMLNPP